MKRPKKAKRLEYDTYTVTRYYCICPHCKTQCVGVSENALMIPCFHCGNPIDFRPKMRKVNPAFLCEEAFKEKEAELQELKKEHHRLVNEAIETTHDLAANNDVLSEKIAKLESAIRKVLSWCDAYPLEVFPEPDFIKAAQVLKDNGMTLDTISASNMRHVLKGVKRLLEM